MNYKVTLNNKVFIVEVEEGEAVLVDEYEASLPAPKVPNTQFSSADAPEITGEGEHITSPMPGNILDVKAEDGAKVKAGDIIIILEAMKMENEITAPSNGTITQMVVSKGQKVDTGDVLFVIDREDSK